MRRLVFLVVFLVLQLLCLPLAVVGIVLVTYRQMLVSKRLGVSQTGIEVINGRWTMHLFGLRDDAPTARLAGALPNTSLPGLWLALFPLWVASKVSGVAFLYPRVPEEGNETVADLVVARTLYFDRIISRVAGDMDQFVLLGAGYDTRAYGALKEQGLACFELDQPVTQALKVAALDKAGVDRAHVTFVPVDFSQGRAFEQLLDAGYDPSRKTLFLWEGVTLYLNEADVRATLRELRGHSAPGSVLVADIYAERFVRFATRGAAGKTLQYTDEGVSFGLPFAGDFQHALQDFLGSEGLAQGEAVFMGRSNSKGPFVVVVEVGLQDRGD